MRRIVIIPARGGSKRIPRKNIKDFCGKPIISYSLENCRSSDLFDTIHVSTEDKEIYNTVARLGYKPHFYRSKETATDRAVIREVLVEVIKKFEAKGEKFDIVCLLSATAPLIDESDLIKACHKFEQSTMEKSLLAVAKYPVPIEWALKKTEGHSLVQPVNDELFFKSSHDFKDAYYDVGSFAFFTRGQLLIPSEEIKFVPYILSPMKGVDIDVMEDWEYTQYLFKNRKH